MSEIFQTIWYGIRQSLTSWKYRLLFVVVFVIFFLLLLALPIIIQSGGFSNFSYTLRGVLGFLRFQDYLTITILSFLYALFVPMQVYAFRQKRAYAGIGTVVGGGVGSLFAGIAGTAFCASCLAPLLGLFGIGFGGVLFVLEYRFYIITAIIVSMIVAIYLISRKINKICLTC